MAVHAQDVRVVTRVVSDTIPAWKTWKENGFAMNHPGKWSVDMATKGDTVVVFRNLKKNEVKSITPVAVIVQGMDGTMTPLQKRLKRADREDVEFITSEDADMSATSRAEYSYDAGGTRMHILEQVVEKGDRSYLLTYAAPESSYEEYLFLAEAMLNSFSAPAAR